MIHSLLKDDIPLPGGIPMSKNTAQITVSFDTQIDIQPVLYQIDSQRQFQRVVVTGARRGACFTVGKRDATLEDGWGAGAPESFYINPDPFIPGIGTMDREPAQKARDSLRTTEIIEEVYTQWIIPDDWDGKAASGDGAFIPTAVCPVSDAGGNLLPLVYLNQELKVGEKTSNLQSDGSQHDTSNIVVLQADDRQFGLVVDGVNDSEDIMVKPLGKQLKGISAFAGATIMGDGKVALILDVLGIAQHANVVSVVRDRTLTDSAAQARERGEDRQALLIFRHGEDGRVGIPLSMVARLEEFPRSSIEKSGTQEVVQYRNEIMPLVRLSNILDGGSYSAPEEKETIQVVVHTRQGRSLGLVVDQIVDIVEERVEVQPNTRRQSILGSAVVQGRVTDLLDVERLMPTVEPELSEHPEAA